MDQTLEQQVAQRLAELPADVRNAIQSNDLGAKIHAIGTKHQLHIDQVGNLETQVYLAMLGFMPLHELPRALQNELGLRPEVATQVVADVNAQIFDSIRDSMKKFAEERAAPQGDTLKPEAPKVSPSPAALATPTKPPVNPALVPADAVLSEKTVSLAPKPAEKPIYKADPYREPV